MDHFRPTLQPMDDARALPETPRTRLGRRPARGSHERAVIDAILDEGLVCHLAFTDEHGACVVPTAYARDGDAVLLHGSPRARWLCTPELPVCLCVTLVDGLVLARSAMHHSMNYRAVVLFGALQPVLDPAAKAAALRTIVEHLVPGRSDSIRSASASELAATAVARLPITEGSAKVRTGGPLDDQREPPSLAWTGVLPLSLQPGAVDDEAPAHVRTWSRGPRLR